ncbi:MAG: ABC-F family ATP-binding cassette domain-containing protein [Nitrospirae bacterium]|nr:ABC-F family ATP-binding cassette domain-containing protein [Nitrospirota bacterium]
MNILDVQNLDKKFAFKQVLDHATFTIGEQEKVGFIGLNGSGKSTLFRIIAGQETKDDGIISTKRGATLGYLSQDPILDLKLTIREELASALHAIQNALRRFEEINHALQSPRFPSESDKLLAEQERLSHWISQHQGWTINHRVEEILLHLEIPDQNQIIGNLSGGLKKRVAIAKLILEAPALLLLDEPTNHLDADTTQWLENYLIDYPGAVMLITHDRYFLDRVVNRIIEVENGALTPYPGSYSRYVEQKAERLVHENRAQSRLFTLLRTETAWIMRGARARTTKSKSRIERYETLQNQVKGPPKAGLQLDFKSDARLGDIILELQYLTKSFGNKTLFKNLLLSLKKGDRIGVIGPNGCGKSTLLKLILKEELPTQGGIILGKNTKISYFDQHRESLDPEQRVEEALGENAWIKVGDETKTKTSYLESFLFSYADQRKIIRTLSGGEKARLILARLMLENSNFLLLDEPTNDLDIPTLQLLDEALTFFKGCVIMVTHDRYFLDKVATGILSFEPGGEVHYIEGNYEIYREWKARKEEQGKQTQKKDLVSHSPSPSRKEKKRLTFKELKEVERLEKEIEALEARKNEINRLMANPAQIDREEMKKIGIEFQEFESLLAEKIERWEILETRKETTG